MNLNKRTALFAGVALSGLALAHGASAQDAESGEAAKKGRVTLLQRLVIGAGVEKVAIDTPQAVTVLNQEDLDTRQAATIGEILRDVPGVNVTGSDRLLGESFNIRGIGAPENTGDGGRIIVNVDGVPKFYEQYRLGSFFSDSELYKRVEVLRGPASSTLYGVGALGGVINFETKDASDFIREGMTGALRIKGGFNSNRNGYLGSTVLAQRMGDRAEFLLTGNYRISGEYRSGDDTTVIGSNFRAWSGLAKGTFNVGDEGKLKVSYQRWDSDLDRQQLSQTSTAAFFGVIDRHVVDQTGVISYENPFSDNNLIDLKASLSYSDTQNTQRNGTMRASCAPGSFAVVCDSDYAYQTWQFKADNTAEWEGDAWKNFLTIGSQTTFQTRVADAYRNNGVPFPVAFHPEGEDFKTGIYAQNEFIWDERLTVIPGVRLDWHRLTPDASIASARETDDTAISPKLAAHYKVNDTVAVFGSVAHTERFPTIDEVFSTSSSASTFPANLNLEKERSNNYEAGFALSGLDLVQVGDSAQLKFTGFYNDVKDLIALNPALRAGANPVPGFINISAAELYGFEVESAYDSDFVFANAAYSYVIGRDKQTNAYLTTIAPHELALTLGGKVPDRDLRFGWRARIVANPQDAARRSHTPIGTSTRYAKAFDVHDAFLTWTPKEGDFAGWQADFGIENIFDRNYKEFLSNDLAKGRTFKVSLSKQFDW